MTNPDKQDTLDAVSTVPESVQDAIDMLNDYIELFEDDAELYGALDELRDHLCEAAEIAHRIRQKTRHKRT